MFPFEVLTTFVTLGSPTSLKVPNLADPTCLVKSKSLKKLSADWTYIFNLSATSVTEGSLPNFSFKSIKVFSTIFCFSVSGFLLKRIFVFSPLSGLNPGILVSIVGGVNPVSVFICSGIFVIKDVSGFSPIGNIDILGFPEVIKSPKLIEKFNKNDIRQNTNMVKNK